MFDLLLLPDFLDAPTLASVMGELRAADGDAATVYGTGNAGAVETGVRCTTRLAPSAATRGLVLQKLHEQQRAVEEYFSVTLSACEEPQFLRYRQGDFFVAHQDGNTPLLRHSSQARTISVVVFLSSHSEAPSPGTYGGGSLVFHGAYPDLGERLPLAPEPGTLVAFRAETTHEVTPVTHGERYTIASWYLR
jgi:SM-20-related protein